MNNIIFKHFFRFLEIYTAIKKTSVLGIKIYVVYTQNMCTNNTQLLKIII